MHKFCSLGIFAILIGTSFAGDDLSQWIKDGKVLLDLNYRLEFVDQENLSKDALASTLRLRLGYETAVWRGLNALVEFEGLGVLGETLYNDTVNGKADRPVVADPEDQELNRLQLGYRIDDVHSLTLGRQRIKLDNDRFIGNVGWRQNEQTFDALIWQWKVRKAFTLKTGYLDNANRIFGEHHPTMADMRMESFIIHGAYQVSEGHSLALFGYFFDIKSNPGLSHRNLGFYDKGKWQIAEGKHLLWEFSYVDQADYKDGNENLDEDYLQAVLGGKIQDFTLKVGYEVLGGDGQGSFMTPFATGHAFQGWADLFLTTPANGIEDLQLIGGYGKAGWNCLLVYHQFSADSGNADYGDELDALITKKLSSRCLLGLKLADYQADTFATDRTKVWGYAQWIW